MHAVRFQYSAFSELAPPEREHLCGELRVCLSHRLAQAQDFYGEIKAIVRELRDVGHDLYNFDEDGEGLSLWCPDWTKGSPPGLVLEFEAPASVGVTWRAAA